MLNGPFHAFLICCSGMNTCILQGVVQGGICDDEPVGSEQVRQEAKGSACTMCCCCSI